MIDICPNLKDKKIREDFTKLTQLVGSDAAYYLYRKANGEFPWNTSSYKKLESTFKVPEAKLMEMYTFINSNQFNKWLGNEDFNLTADGNITNHLGEKRLFYDIEKDDFIPISEPKTLDPNIPPTSVETILGRLSKDTTAFTEVIEGVRVLRPKVKTPEGKELYSMEAETGEIKLISMRVSTLVERYYRRIFKNKLPTDESNLQFAELGTVVDSYRNILMETMAEDHEKKFTYKEIRDKVIKELKGSERFKDKPDSFFEINQEDFKELATVQRNLFNRINKLQEKIDPNGEFTILTQQVLYDENKDIVGTPDLLVIFSDGKAAIYDYKVIFKWKESVKGNKKTLRSYKEGAYEVQLGEYSRILSSKYGVNGFVERKILPMEGNVKDNKLRVRSDFKGETYAEHLEEIPLFDDEIIDDPITNSRLKKMFELRKVLKSKQEKNTTFDRELQDKIDRLTKSIRKLQNNLGPYWVFREIKDVLSDFEDKRKDGLSLDVIKEFTDYLTTYKGYLMESMDRLLKNIKDEPSRDKKELEILRIEKVIDASLRELNDLAQAELVRETGFEPNNPEKEEGFWKKLFGGLGDFARNQFKMLYNIVQKNEAQIHLNLTKDIKDIEDTHKKLKDYAKSTGKNIQHYFDMLFDDKTGNLINRFSGQYSKEKKAAIAKKDIKWFLENTNVKIDGDNLSFIDPEATKRFNEAKELQFKKIDSWAASKQFKEEKKEEWLNTYDITYNTDALFNSNNRFIRLELNDTNRDRFESNKWKEISKHAPVMNYYDMYVRFNRKYAALTGHDIEDNFLANIHKTTLDAAFRSGKINFSVLKSSLLESFRSEQHEQNKYLIDPTTGKPIMTIPLLYTNPKLTSLSSSKMKEIKRNLDIRDPEYNNKLKKAVYEAQLEEAIEAKNRDLTKGLILFAHSAYTNHYYTQTETLALSVLNSMKNTETVITDNRGKKMIDWLNKKTQKFLGASADELSTMEKFINYYWYGQTLQNKDVEFKTKDAKTLEDGTTKLYSLNKAVRNVMNYVAAKDLGLSWIVAVGSGIQTFSTLYVKATEGRMFKKAHVTAAIKAIVNGDDKTKALIEYINPYGRNPVFEKARELSASRAAKIFNNDALFIMLKKPDEMFDRVTLISTLMNHTLEDGQIVRLDKAKNKNAKSLYDTATVSEDKGLVVPGITDNLDGYVRIRKIQIANMQALKGSIPYDNMRTASMNIWMQLLTQYKNWIPGLVSDRFNKMRYRNDVEDFDVGRYRIMFGEFSGGIMNKIGAFRHLALEVFSLFKYNRYEKGYRKEFAEQLYNKFIEENPEFTNKLTLEEFIELRKAKLRGAALELRIMLGLFLFMQLLRGLSGDDEDDPVRHYVAENMFRFTQRGMLELSFFLDPGAFLSIANRPIAILGTLTTLNKAIKNTIDEAGDDILGEEDNRDKTKRWHYTSRLVWGNRFFTDWLDAYNYIKL